MDKLKSIWCLAVREEMMSVMWLIAALIAWLIGGLFFQILAFIMFGWACFGFLTAIRASYDDYKELVEKEKKEEKKKHSWDDDKDDDCPF